MVIGFDVGNTSTTAGLYSEDSHTPFASFRYPTKKNSGHGELYETIMARIRGHAENIHFTGSVISSVVPELVSIYEDMAARYMGQSLLSIDHACRLRIKLNYINPSELGPDRIANAEAAFVEYGADGLIIDIGTAATFCVLNKGVFDGGIIAPGIGTTIKALASSASRLPDVEFGMPQSLIARDTVNAIKSGFFYGWISLVEGLIIRIKHETGRELKTILTGGFAADLSPHISQKHILDQMLCMKGIKLIFDYNR
jgi:type III pantothenate kinase